MRKIVKVTALCVMVLVLICSLLVINRQKGDKTDDGQVKETTTTSSHLILPDEDSSGDVDVIIPTVTTTNSTSMALTGRNTTTNDELATPKATTPTRSPQDDGWLPDVGAKATVER